MLDHYNPTVAEKEENDFAAVQFLYSLENDGYKNTIQTELAVRRVGLSNVHIGRKRNGIKAGTKRVWRMAQRPSINDRGGSLEIWQDASLVSVSRPRSWTSYDSVGGKRGAIAGFSRHSRNRLLRTVAKLQRSRRPLFITLTYPDEFVEKRLDGEILKRKHLKNFYKRMQYRYPEMGLVWKLEYVERKSGEHQGVIFPHFHLIAWGLEGQDIFDMRDYVAGSWWEVCGKLSEDHRAAGTRVERLRSVGGVLYYASKYLGKEVRDVFDDREAPINVGRWWGLMGRERLPFSYCQKIDFLEPEHYQKIIRYLNVVTGLPIGDWVSINAYCDAAKFFYEDMDKLLFVDKN